MFTQKSMSREWARSTLLLALSNAGLGLDLDKIDCITYNKPKYTIYYMGKKFKFRHNGYYNLVQSFNVWKNNAPDMLSTSDSEQTDDSESDTTTHNA